MTVKKELADRARLGLVAKEGPVVQEVGLHARCICGTHITIVETDQPKAHVCYNCNRRWMYTCKKICTKPKATYHKFEGEWHWKWEDFES